MREDYGNMTNKKIVRIQNGEDFIDIESSSKYELEIQSQLVMNNVYWDNYYDFIQSKNQKGLNLQGIKTWLQKIKEQNNLSKVFPQVDFLTAHYLSRDIFSSNLIPQYISPLSLTTYNHYSPEIIINQNLNDIKLNQPSLSSRGLKPKPLNKKEYKILRLLDETNRLFIDLKISKFSEKQIITEILSLPLFWRNYHLVSRTRVVDNFHENIDFNLNSHLLQFYNPSNEFLLKPKEKAIVYDKDAPTRWRQITSKFNKLDLQQLANQLMFINPGYILPLTYRESRWSSTEEPDFTAKITDKEAHLISIKIKDSLTESEMYSFFMDCIEKINIEDREAIYKLTPNKNIGNGQYILAKDGNIIYVYEQNILDVFQMLSLYDSQNNIQD